MNARCCIAIVLLAVMVAPAAAQEQKEGVALTVYNGGYGVVREVRKVNIGEDGMAKFIDVASAIDATTVHFKSLTDPAAKLLEQNYQYDLVSADKLLRKYIDRPIDVVCKDAMYSGVLMSFDGAQIVLRERKGSLVMVQRADNVRDIRFRELPEGLLTRPTLVWKVATQRPGEHLSEVTYQTGGLGWHAEYVLVLNQTDTAADLSGWVSVQNNSGKIYKDAKLKFIAGDVRRVQPQPRPVMKTLDRMARGPEAAPMAEKAFFEYHMYTLPRPSTVADNEIKQLEMFTPARGVKVEKKFLYNPLGNFRWNYGGRYTDRSYGVTSYKKVHVLIHFRNSKANELGMPLPAGKVRVYKQDPADKAMEFIGEEQIDHTPRNEKLELRIGNAFDLVGERKQTNFQTWTRRMRETIEIKLRNQKEDEAVVIRVKEPMYRWTNREILNSSHKYEELDARTFAWDIKVEPEKEVTLTYTVEYTW